MPQVILWALGAVGAAAIAKLLAVASRRVNANLEDIRRSPPAERPTETLVQDPETGEYRPPKA